MPDQESASVTQQQDAVKANWGAVIEDYGEVKVETQQQSQEKDPQKIDNEQGTEILDTKTEENKEEVKEEKKEEVKAEETKEEAKAETEEKKDEAKTENIETLLSAEDIKDIPKQFEEGSWGELGKDLGLEVKEDSHEAFVQSIKENFVPKAEYEKALSTKLEDIYANLKPETAVALKLMEMGVSQEEVFERGKEIDSYLSLSAEELIRADLNLRRGEGWTDELIDAKMEELAKNPKELALREGELRIILNNQKKALIEERNSLLQQYEQQRQEVSVRQKQQEVAQFNQALDKFDTFMGQPVTKAIKDAIRAKYNSGSYSDVVSKADSQIAAIMYKEYGDKLAKLLQNKAAEEAKFETAKKLLNVPPVKGGNAGQKVEITAENQKDNNWGAILEDFKK